MRSKRRSFTLLVTLLCLLSTAAPSQTEHPPTPRTDLSAVPADDAEARDRMARDLAKKANEARAAALKADTDRLLKLAVELKTYVDKSNENVLSLDVIKKAEAIEKLAHSVKEKMKGPN